MGWSTWNAFHRHFTEQTFYDTADLMAANGMQAAGYEYINVRAMMPPCLSLSAYHHSTDRAARGAHSSLTCMLIGCCCRCCCCCCAWSQVDGGWWNSTKPAKGHPTIYRNATGYPSWDPVKYPRGLPALIDYIHKKVRARDAHGPLRCTPVTHSYHASQCTVWRRS
eukprot:SAG31_NODE_5305_length_2620_cov_8.778263_2_plen_166_part_00